MISYYDVSGCYILRPWAYAVWEAIQAWFDGEIKRSGVQNAYFPLFITEAKLNTEKDHVEGFAAEVAWVTKSGSSDLERPIAIRPTSETVREERERGEKGEGEGGLFLPARPPARPPSIFFSLFFFLHTPPRPLFLSPPLPLFPFQVMYPYFADWVRSHRDLPLRLNQWTNVVRWEFKHPTPFIRTREFLWQEGHTAFATRAEAEAEVMEILDLYARVYTDLLAVPVVKGRKSDAERFAGALFTTSVEGYIPAAGRGVQGATSHCLGQNFSKMFGIEFETAEKAVGGADGPAKAHAWQNSWGISTRAIGVMVMSHGDDKGLVMPPAVAATQCVAIPIVNSKMGPDEHAALGAAVDDLLAGLKGAGVRVASDARADKTPGWKYAHWEVKGVPLRLEVGPRDLGAQTAVLVRRDTGAKEVAAWADLAARVPALLAEVQADMLAARQAEFDACLETATEWDAFMAALDRKHMVLAPWADEEAVEKDVRARSASGDAMGAKTLCIPFDQPPLPEGTACFASGKPAKNWALWGRSY